MSLLATKKHMRVMEFINVIKGHKNESGHDAHEVITKIFSRGNCYMFARALKIAFPEGEIYNFDHFMGVHVLFKLGDRLYDISGDVTESYKKMMINPITEDQENYARTFCYSHKIERAHGLDDGKGRMSESEFRNRLGIQDKIEEEVYTL